MAYQYTEEEKLAFRKKDKRISIQGLVQTLMRCIDKPDLLSNPEEMVKLAKYYSDEIERVVNETVGNIEVDCGNMWEQAAKHCGCPVPTEQEQKILNIIKESVAENIENGIEPETVILLAIDQKFGKYPKNKASVSKCVKLFN